MFMKFNKCVFDLKEIDYLKFIVKVNNIRMNFAKIVTIKMNKINDVLLCSNFNLLNKKKHEHYHQHHENPS
jgi:hypothetical protein